MVKLKRENDGFKRNKTSGFQAIGPLSINRFTEYYEFGRKGIEAYEWVDRPVPKPYRNILVSPIGFGKSTDTLARIKELKDEGIVENVMFDSAGFQVLTGAFAKRGITTLEHLEVLNEDLYHKYDWADIYVMPDHPPNRADVWEEGYREKVDNTIEASLRFFDKLDPKIQGKTAPVFHIRRESDIDYQYEAYKPILDVSKFATFSASALTMPGCPRQLKGESLFALDKLQKKLAPENIGLHCLGIGSPPAIFMLNYLGIRTYDSTTAIIGAGLGKVYFPYRGGSPCSDKRADNKGNLTQLKLDALKAETNHECPFCEDVIEMKRESNDEGLTPGYYYRIYHNFCVLDDLNWVYNDLNLDLLKEYAPLQWKDFMKICGEDDQIDLLAL